MSILVQVEQTDIHVPLATVSEALAFSAALRSPTSSKAQISAAVRQVLDLVDLTAISGRLVGTQGTSDTQGLCRIWPAHSMHHSTTLVPAQAVRCSCITAE